MSTIAVRVALEAGDELGEGPIWRDSTGELLRVDILRGRAHAWRPATGEQTTTRFAPELGAIVPRRRGGLVAAVERELLLVEPDGARRTLASVAHEPPGNRFNDCRCDSQGRLWAGTMSRLRAPGVAALYRLEAGGELECALVGTTLSNGIGWSPDGATMYFVDSTTQRIDALDFNGRDGTVTNRRAFAAIEPAAGMPDGLTVDAEGGVWIALFGGGAVRRYDDAGLLDAVVELPVPHPTCPAFGGPEFATLYVTSSRHRLTPEQRAELPSAGAVFACEPGVRGLPAGAFAG